MSIKTDFEIFPTTLIKIEPLSYARLNRLDTKWQLEYVTATICFLNHLQEYLMGCVTEENLPPRLRNNRYICILHRNTTGNKNIMINNFTSVVWLCTEVSL